MRVSKTMGFIFLMVLVLSGFLAKICKLITVEYSYAASEEFVFDRSRVATNLSLGDKNNKHLMWFMQISDIHLSVFHDKGRISDFDDFCNTTLDVIRPTVVLASGDLADSKAIDSMGSRQFVQEWQYYQSILKKNNVEDKTIWLDIRGNHDNFDVPRIDLKKSYYHHFSVQGKHHLRSYMTTITKDEEKFNFIGVDACLDPGPRRPFNFIGLLKLNEYKLLEQFEVDTRNSTGTVWFGHYPTSCIISPDPGIRELMKRGVAYLCGHLHTLGGTVPKMYTLHHSGTLELELGDWKDNRLFRIAAFDHGLFSFTDISHGKWPIILITNPKHALFILPKKEPLELIGKSTHIRVLVFSPTSLEVVKVKLDNNDWIVCQHSEGPLFIAKWNPQQFSSGLHEIFVYARNTNGEYSEIIQPFSLDESKASFGLFPRIALMLDADECFYNSFVLLVVVSVFPLGAIRLLHHLVRGGKLILEKSRFACRSNGRGLLRKLWILATVNKLFYPIILYPVYITIGPWFIGEVIEGHYGAVFAWGILVQGKMLPGSFTYFYGFIQLLLFHIPFVLLISHCADCRFKSVCWNASPCNYTSPLWQHIPCFLILGLQTLFAYSFWLAYGTMALIIGPLRTWSILTALYMWYSASTLQSSDFQSTASVLIPGFREQKLKSKHESF